MSGRAEIAVYAPGQLNESYTIDPWGNMLPSGSVSNPNLSFAVNNRYELPASYEDSGNLVSIGGNSYCGAGQTYTYNAEAQMSCGEGVNYTYDGDGARVKKSSGTLYWGGDAGSALTESDLSGTITSEYVFLNGKRIARQDAGGAVYYYFTDMLGSSNVVTDANGVTQNESDIWPFGVEHVILDNLTNQHYKYTGKERDQESGNDYFGARYYSSAMGRFMSPDPILQNDLRLLNPQRWNKYAYVINNPLILTDPTGLDAVYVNFSGMAGGFGHSGVMSVHSDGSATFSYKDGQGQIHMDDSLPKVQFGANGTPTAESYASLAKAVADFDTAPGQAPIDPASVGFVYFKTTDSETASLDQYIAQRWGNQEKYRLGPVHTTRMAGVSRANSGQTRRRTQA